MNIREASYADLKQMFQATLVRYNNQPVFIHCINEDYTADIQFISNNDEQRVKLEDKLWNFKPVPLGYVNINGYCFYLSRSPLRQWKQGLHRDNMNVVYSQIREHDNRWMVALDRARKIACAPLYNCINNIYPSLEQAIDLVQEDVEVAFDRQFAIDNELNIFYKTKVVGQIQDNKIVFMPEKEYLRKALCF